MRLGRIQQAAFTRLQRGEEIRNYSQTLRGKAKMYAPRYKKSFLSLLEKMKGEGYRILRTPGTKGGEYSATYRIKQCALFESLKEENSKEKEE